MQPSEGWGDYTPEDVAAIFDAARRMKSKQYGKQTAERHRYERKRRLALAVLHVLHFMRLRRIELLNLRVSDVDLEARTLRVYRGRRRIPHTIPFNAATEQAIRAWIEVRYDSHGLWSYHQTGMLCREGLTALLLRLSRDAGFDGREGRPQPLRPPDLCYGFLGRGMTVAPMPAEEPHDPHESESGWTPIPNHLSW